MSDAAQRFARQKRRRAEDWALEMYAIARRLKNDADRADIASSQAERRADRQAANRAKAQAIAADRSARAIWAWLAQDELKRAPTRVGHHVYRCEGCGAENRTLDRLKNLDHEDCPELAKARPMGTWLYRGKV